MIYEQACPRCGVVLSGDEKDVVADAVVDHARSEHGHALDREVVLAHLEGISPHDREQLPRDGSSRDGVSRPSAHTSGRAAFDDSMLRGGSGRAGVVSIFGAMFAPRPFDVAQEMVRVTQTGGRIVMGNWIPGDPTLVAQILKISAAYSPPPPEGFVSPVTWGIADNVVERFVAAGVPEANILCQRDTFVFKSPTSPSEFLAVFRTYYGPTMNAFEAAEANGRADDLERELDVLFNEQNQSPNDETTSIPATFLRVTVEL